MQVGSPGQGKCGRQPINVFLSRRCFSLFPHPPTALSLKISWGEDEKTTPGAFCRGCGALRDAVLSGSSALVTCTFPNTGQHVGASPLPRTSTAQADSWRRRPCAALRRREALPEPVGARAPRARPGDGAGHGAPSRAGTADTATARPAGGPGRLSSRRGSSLTRPSARCLLPAAWAHGSGGREPCPTGKLTSLHTSPRWTGKPQQ